VKRARSLLAPAIVFAILAAGVQPQESHAPAPQTPPAGAPSPSTQPQGAEPQGAAAQAEPPSITVTTRLVHLVVTVEDRDHNFITDLARSDFTILENGVPQEIRFFGAETNLPLRIGLLLDTSNSIRPRLKFEQDAATDFLDRVIRQDQDMAFVMTFDNEPEVVQDYTTDLSLLTAAVRKQRAGGGTALDDAVFQAAAKLSDPPLPKGPDPQVRRVIVVISDGDDNLSDHALSDSIESAIRSEAAVYAVSTSTEWLAIDDENAPKKYHLTEGDSVLKQFSSETGGRVFFPYKIDDLAQSFMDIGDELRRQYFIAYAPAVPPLKGEYRTIEVRTDRKGLVVRTRKGYYAAPAPSVPK
jgi:Ca-activated chloride channel homolog